VPSSGGFIEGVEMSSLGELVDLMDDHDRLIFIGGDDR
jgi:sulfur relay (sulfurtransferase) complex TusBCD TusD component (DsrE family)